MIGKKADWFMDNWPEWFALILLVIGFIIAVSAGSAVVLYIISILFGSIFGRWMFRFRKKLKVPGEKDLDREWLRKCGYHLFAGLGDGVDLALRQVQSKKEGNARRINQGDGNQVDEKFNIIS